MTKRIRISISIKENETFDKKEKSRLRHNSKRTRIEIFTLDIYET